MLKKNNIIYAFACDFENYRGEGILARNYLKYNFKNQKCTIFTPFKKYTYIKNTFRSNKNFKRKINHSFLYKYFSPFYGLLLINILNIFGKKTIYLNFLPLWNFFLFCFLPRKTLLGPITGSANAPLTSGINKFLRIYIFPVFYKFSIFFLKKRHEILFSRNLLNSRLPEDILNRSKFNFQIYSYLKLNKQKKLKKKKYIDLIYYHRDHQNKNNQKIFSIINDLANKGFNIHIIGDCCDIPKTIHHGIINQKDVSKLLNLSKFVIAPNENLFSFYILDSIRSYNRIFFYSNSERVINKDFKYIFSYFNINTNISRIVNKLSNKILNDFNYKLLKKNVKAFYKFKFD